MWSSHQIINLDPIKMFKLLSNTLSFSTGLIRVPAFTITFADIDAGIGSIVTIVKFVHVEG